MKYMVFDVESIGLHGEGFAVGWVVVDESGNELDSNMAATSPDAASGGQEGRLWVAQNVPRLAVTHDWPRDMRTFFWEAWQYWKKKGAALVADCAWPVEARFLCACVDEAPDTRTWEGPHPLHDLASIMLANGADPLKTRDRLPNELPAHVPLFDARQSARLLITALSAPTPGTDAGRDAK